MIKKILSLTITTALIASTVACGSTSTSLYRSSNNLGDQISNNISKIMNDAERNMSTNTVNDTKTNTLTNKSNTTRTLYNDTYDMNKKIVTNNISNGYANNYVSTVNDTKYNGVDVKTTTNKTNTINTIPLDTNIDKTNKTNKTKINDTLPVPKTNNIDNIPLKTNSNTKKMQTSLNTVTKENTMKSVNKTDVVTNKDVPNHEFVRKTNSVDRTRNISTSIDRVLYNTDDTINDTVGDMTYSTNKINGTNPQATIDTPIGTSGSSDVSPMIIA